VIAKTANARRALVRCFHIPQVYAKTGKLSKTLEMPWTPATPPADGEPKESGGAVVAIDFSHDPGQTVLNVINQNNGVVEIVERQTGKILSSFGRVGHFPGEFDQPHGIAVDSEDTSMWLRTAAEEFRSSKRLGIDALAARERSTSTDHLFAVATGR